ncbi:hypothetical protein G7K_0413-t1 [Saitoella complicata NRRL Y-17804]|uniref:Uncharacterized protein n=1 Tax=Saitoella complicata (strain BCRC 22490 / CBS 7301 / JCM 7358 / NBRC 10748 / NRRL Y-17804) TaxID=698492 RepID=A0A0E9N8Z2_SAICN|nr:hypothetical protein G7K_0413-t1 [Saitoella complicata NRRL Y-17804]
MGGKPVLSLLQKLAGASHSTGGTQWHTPCNVDPSLRTSVVQSHINQILSMLSLSDECAALPAGGTNPRDVQSIGNITGV